MFLKRLFYFLVRRRLKRRDDFEFMFCFCYGKWYEGSFRSLSVEYFRFSLVVREGVGFFLANCCGLSWISNGIIEGSYE